MLATGYDFSKPISFVATILLTPSLTPTRRSLSPYLDQQLYSVQHRTPLFPAERPSMAGFSTIKVLAYNVWGMPRQFGGKQKSLRFPKLAKMLREGCQRKEYDVVLLSELWMKHDHETIKQEMVKFKVKKKSHDS